MLHRNNLCCAVYRLTWESADVLRDASKFPVHDVAVAQCVEEGGLAVVHVTHDGDDGWTFDQVWGIWRRPAQIIFAFFSTLPG